MGRRSRWGSGGAPRLECERRARHKLRNTHLAVGGEDEVMPPPGRDLLTEPQLELLESWILGGALKD